MERQSRHQGINNTFYEELGTKWYTENEHPIALLRAENAVRVPWVAESIGSSVKTVLDIGCGAGFLTNALAKQGHKTFGIDLSPSSLMTAQSKDETGTVSYLVANAYSLPFPDKTFDVVTAMDVLEHVEEPHLLIAEASRVLKPDGLFFFHTFNRNLLSYIIIIKGVEWCVRNAPQNMHVYPLFIKPRELKELCAFYNLEVQTLRGFIPKINQPFFKMLFTRKIPPEFSFCFAKSLQTGYCGTAQKRRYIHGSSYP